MAEIKEQIKNQDNILLQHDKILHFEAQIQFSSTQISKNISSTILDQLYTFYLYQGPVWKSIKSQTCSGLKDPKNFLYNAIRKSAKLLTKFGEQLLSRCRRGISKDSLLYLLQIINQVQKEIIIRNLTLNQSSLLFTFKKNILRFSLWENSFSLSQIYDLIKLTKQISLKLRCLSIFKSKNRKNWKLSQRGFQLIYSYDKVFIESGHSFHLEDEQQVAMLKGATCQPKSFSQEESFFSCSMYSFQNILFMQAQIKQKTLEEQVNQILNISEWESRDHQEDYF